jgi:hypothetical protein
MANNKERAEVEVELTGVEQSAQKIGTLESAFALAGKAIESNVGGALKAVGSSLTSIAMNGARAAGIFKTIDLADGVGQVKSLDKLTAQLGQTAGASAEDLKALFESVEKRGGASAVALAQAAKSISEVTYDSRDAAESVGALADLAHSIGRDIGQELPLGVALHNAGFKAKDLQDEIGKLIDIANKLKVQGGPTALLDTVAALGPALAHVSKEGNSFNKTVAFLAQATKNMDPAKAREVSGQMLDDMRTHATDIERTLGHKITDDKTGDLLDPAATYAELDRKRRGKGGKEIQRRIANGTYGTFMGAALLNADFQRAAQVAEQAKDTGAVQKGAAQYRATEGGKDEVTDIKNGAAARDVSQPLVDAGRGVNRDSPYTSTALSLLKDGISSPGFMGLLGLGGGAAASGGGGSAVANGARTAVQAGGTVLGALGIAGTAGMLATAGATGYVLNDIGQKRLGKGSMQEDWQNKHAELMGGELAMQAMRAGDVTPVIGKAQGNEQVIEAMMNQLQAHFNELNGTLKGQAEAFANAMAEKRLKVEENKPRDYTVDRGNG